MGPHVPGDRFNTRSGITLKFSTKRICSFHESLSEDLLCCVYTCRVADYGNRVVYSHSPPSEREFLDKALLIADVSTWHHTKAFNRPLGHCVSVTF